eukprot:6265566-Pyramimonas_sp.AAC.1
MFITVRGPRWANEVSVPQRAWLIRTGLAQPPRSATVCPPRGWPTVSKASAASSLATLPYY